MDGMAAKQDAWETLLALNRGFVQVLDVLRQIEHTGLLEVRPMVVEGLRVTVEEARAWANFELTEVLHGRAESDWERYGRLRREWEQNHRELNG
jgi:hypothetical protein